MANVKVSDLPELAAAPDNDDLLYIVDSSDPSGASKKITVQNLRNVGTTAGTVAAGDDARLSDARTPTAHASTHATGGFDALTPADIGAAALNDPGQSITCAQIEASGFISSPNIAGEEVSAINASFDSIRVTNELGAAAPIVSDGSNQLALRSAGSPQSFAVYRTSSGSNANYERVRLVADGTRFFLRPENAGTGTLRPLIVRMVPQTVAALPAASTAGAGARAVVSDASSPTFGATVTGGGSTLIPVYSDGTEWRVG